MEHKQVNERYASAGYQSAVGTVIAAGVFAAVIAAFLAWAAYHYTVTDPARAAQLEKLKEEAKTKPADEKLAAEVLVLDTQVRRDQLARVQFLKRGTGLLVGTLALGVWMTVRARGYTRRYSLPGREGDVKAELVKQAEHVRAGLTAAVVILAGGALFWSLRVPGENATPTEAGHTEDQTAAIPEEIHSEDVSFATMEEMEAEWPTFRGPGGLGVCGFTNVPTEWDAKSGKNILWKMAVPLAGNGSPVVWGKRVFVSGGSAEKQQVFAFDADTGKLLWTGDVKITEDPAREDMNIMEDTGFAASTPVTDGRRVCAIFAGGDIGCFTAEGQLLWQKHLGVPDSMYGYAASLTAFEKAVIVQWDVGGEAGASKLIALNWQTGETLWGTARPVPNSWASPTVVKVGDAYRVLTAASPYVIAYDAKTGAELFRAECVEGDIAATPIYANGMLFTMEPYQKLVAVKTEGAAGDVTKTHIAWEAEGGMPDICSPVSDGVSVWTLASDGNLDCYKTADGSEVYEQSLEGMYQASPVLAAGKLYLLAQDGTMVVAEAGNVYKEIGRNALGEDCVASPAFAEGRIYIRAKEHLYCIGAK